MKKWRFDTKKERNIQILDRYLDRYTGKLCSPFVLFMDLEILDDECP